LCENRPAQLILERQRFGLELDPVVTRDTRPHVELRGRLHVRMAELEHHLRVAYGEAVLIGDAPSQDERIVVEPEIRGVQEEHFPDLGLQHHALRREPDTKLLGRPTHELAILLENLGGGEAVGLEDQLALEVLNVVERMSVTVFPRLEIRHSVGLSGHACCLFRRRVFGLLCFFTLPCIRPPEWHNSDAEPCRPGAQAPRIPLALIESPARGHLLPASAARLTSLPQATFPWPRAVSIFAA
jgi:hypothetical protein